MDTTDDTAMDGSAPTPPELVLPTTLTRDTERQYRAVHRWLLCTWWTPAWRGDAPDVEAFLCEALRDGRAHRTRVRLAQTLVNQHWRPRPSGPPVQVRGPRPSSSSSSKDEPRLGAAWWRHYVPRHLLRRWAGEADPPPEDWFRLYVECLGACALRCGLIRSYVSYVHRILVEDLGCRTPAALLALRRDTLVDAILRAVPRGRHPQRLCRIAVNRFLEEVVFRDAPGLVRAALHMNGRDLERARRGGGRGPPPGDGHPALAALVRERDHFTESEVAALLRHPGLSRRDRLVLSIMAETGLRRRAVSWLTVDAVYDRTGGAARPRGHATEKGLVTRTFVLSDPTRRLLEEYMTEDHRSAESPWLFPNRHNPCYAPLSPATINGILVRACRAVGVRGRHVHSHGLRKFVIVRLMHAKNRVEDVCKWIGHRAINTTYHTYWDVTPEELSADMNIPWLAS